MAEKMSSETRLRKQLARLLAKPSKMSTAISVLKTWQRRGWGPILFGGVVRDLVVLGRRHFPRDVDVVLANVRIEELIEDLVPHEYRLNRFGGLHAIVNRWSFDVWPLERTWAFTHDPNLMSSAENLPKTTFLNIEAVAVTFSTSERIGKIYSHGFFEGIERKCIAINYRDNPYPALSAIRAVMTAVKLRYRISADLADYFVQVVNYAGASELVTAQEHHYQKVVFRKADVEALKDHFARELDHTSATEIELPHRYQPTQLSFWPPPDGRGSASI